MGNTKKLDILQKIKWNLNIRIYLKKKNQIFFQVENSILALAFIYGCRIWGFYIDKNK